MCLNLGRVRTDSFTRRRLLAGLGSLAAGGAAAHALVPHSHGGAVATAQAAPSGHTGPGPHAAAADPHRHGFQAGRTVDHAKNGFNPTDILRDFDWGKTRRLPSGRVLREWEVVALDKEIEVAPGVTFPAWTFNGRVPGPTLRCREGELLRIKFVNGAEHPHSMHFHGVHPARMDGLEPLRSGQRFTYEFDAAPFGMHHYHCHVPPLAAHIHKGLYGAFIVDPREGRPEADEMVMVLNGFDTNFDLSNDIYAVNTVGFHYENEPIQVERGELTRIYLLNILEFDQLNSFHIHGNFFNYFPTGTRLEPSEFTDTIAQAQGQRGIVEVRFPYEGRFLFHAHKTEFAELGWLGSFEVKA